MPQAQPELKKVSVPPTICAFFVPRPELTSCLFLKYMEKRVFCQLNGNRKVIGILRGYDVFMNIVLDEAFEEKNGGEKVSIGMIVIRGNSVVMLEALERISDK
ncbi:Ribonucleoprotein LSM domain, eukaryotic/archaea-type [Penicillium italicum]|uniref:Small nuclear ribonucleoprotein G n=1 Tax=Penicillium italicum TaxID=40296 RepID=A0A0A2KWZ1_PENIT|nr:Ribonucleoprotein LSM domain, eukaryotic/archaea-type [Penicillium italicum]